GDQGRGRSRTQGLPRGADAEARRGQPELTDRGGLATELKRPVAMAVVASADAGLRAGSRATILQLRAPSLTARDLEHEASRLVQSSPVPVLISSRCDVAVAMGAAGVNLPERDIGTEFARGLIRRGLLGRSVHSLATAQRAEIEGVDFVIFGPVWPSASH